VSDAQNSMMTPNIMTALQDEIMDLVSQKLHWRARAIAAEAHVETLKKQQTSPAGGSASTQAVNTANGEAG
jgi:hypothetical protein